MGPGKGTLSCDIIRTFKQLNMLSKMTFYYVEISETLKTAQQENIIDALRKENIFVSQDMDTKDLYDEELDLKFVWKKNLQQISKEEFEKK